MYTSLENSRNGVNSGNFSPVYLFSAIHPPVMKISKLRFRVGLPNCDPARFATTPSTEKLVGDS